MMEADEIQANLVTFNSLIRACASVGDVVSARVYFDEISNHGFEPDEESYTGLLATLAAAQALGHSHQAKHFLTRKVHS